MKNTLLLSITTMALLSLFSGSVNASENSQIKIENKNEILGGWTEEEGLFSHILDSRSTKATVKHTGKADYRYSGVKQEKRAHGWTTWQNVYHYTTAQMHSLTGKVLSNSRRRWGTSGTEAISPYVGVGEIPGSAKAKTFYGK